MINRVLFSDNGTITDKSKELNNYHSDIASLVIVADEDYLYISSEFPFNHLYFEVPTVASSAMDFTLSVYNGTEFKDVVDTIDETSGFTSSGFITWTPDKDEGWGYEDTEEITELSTVNIYNKYWVRIAFESSDTIGLNWAGNRFSNDEDLADSYPSLNTTDVQGSFLSGKTDWDEQHIVVATDIINDLKIKGTIEDKAQILVRRQLSQPAVHRLARLIFNSFGEAYRDQRDDAQKDYRASLNSIKLISDQNNTGAVERSELTPTTGELVR